MYCQIHFVPVTWRIQYVFTLLYNMLRVYWKKKEASYGSNEPNLWNLRSSKVWKYLEQSVGKCLKVASKNISQFFKNKETVTLNKEQTGQICCTKSSV